MLFLKENREIKDVTIIGGSGCIGSATCNYFISKGINVTVIDVNPPANKNINFIYCDIRNFDQLNESLRGSKYVFILAAISDANENCREPVKSMDINICGLNNILIASKNNNIERVLFSSTVWVYSECKDVNVNEESIIPSNYVNHNYTASKISCEMLIRSYYNMFGLKYTIMRYGIAYGPGTNNNTAISTFIRRIANGQSININGDGASYRNFMYVTDHARANLAALHKNAINQTINFDGPESISIKDIAITVRNIIGKNIDINYTDSIKGDYKGKNVCNNKAYNLLDWQPKTFFKDGILKQINIICQK